MNTDLDKKLAELNAERRLGDNTLKAIARIRAAREELENAKDDLIDVALADIGHKRGDEITNKNGVTILAQEVMTSGDDFLWIEGQYKTKSGKFSVNKKGFDSRDIVK